MPSRPLKDISISGLISEGLLVHTWPVCVSMQSADVSRQMLFLHSRNTICKQRLKHSTASLRCSYALMYLHFAKTYNRHMNFETVSAVNMCECVCVNYRDRLNVSVCMCIYICMKGAQGACLFFV